MAVTPASSGLAWVVLIAALVFAIVGLVKKGAKKGLALAAVIIAPVAWIISIIVFFVSIATGVGTEIQNSLDEPVDGSSQVADDVTGDEEAEAEVPAEEVAESTPGVGDTITNNEDVSFTVTQVKCGIKEAGEKYLEEKAAGQFCRVKFTIKNGSTDSISIYGDDVSALLGEATYDVSSSTINKFGDDYFGTEINPGLSAKSVVYFDMPSKTKPDFIKYVPTFSFFTDDILIAVK